MKENKKVIILSLIFSILGSAHLFYIFNYLPKNFIILTLVVDLFVFIIFVNLMLYIRKLYHSEQQQKKILFQTILEDNKHSIQISLKVKSMLEYLKDSQISKEFLSIHQSDFLDLENFEIKQKEFQKIESVAFLKIYLDKKNKFNRILLDYIQKSNLLMKQFTVQEYITTLLAIKLNLDFFKSYLEYFFHLMDKVYQQIHIFSQDFHLNTKIIEKEIEILQDHSKKIQENFQDHNQKIYNFIEFVKNFNQTTIDFINQISSDYQKNLDFLKNIQEISEKIKMLSLNLSIEASRTSSNKVFDVLAQELQNFSQKIQNFSNQIKEEILQTNDKIQEETKSQLNQTSKMKSQINELTSIQNTIQNFFTEFQSLNQNLIYRSKEVLEKSENSIKEFLGSYQNLEVIEESFKNFFILIEQKNAIYEQSLKEVMKIIYGDESKIFYFLEEVIKDFINKIKTEKELEVIYSLCDQYNLQNLKKEIRTKFSDKDIILF